MIAGQEVTWFVDPADLQFGAFVQENVLVPPWTQVDVPVWLAWTTYERGANKTPRSYDKASSLHARSRCCQKQTQTQLICLIKRGLCFRDCVWELSAQVIGAEAPPFSPRHFFVY